MTEVVFYRGIRNPQRFLEVFLGKHIVGAGRRALLVFGSSGEAQEASDRLWAAGRELFIPSCVAGDDEEEHTPVIMTADRGRFPGARPSDIMVNRTRSVPAGFERFPRLVEIVGTDESEKRDAQGREERYAAGGHKVESHDLRGKF